MVSRTIEGAQTRVEGYNFDTRKHVVEYDDVINRQRETIYRERDRILRSPNLGADDPGHARRGGSRRWSPITPAGGVRGRVEPRRPQGPADDHGPDPDRCGPRGRIDDARDAERAGRDARRARARARTRRKRAEVGEEGIGVLERLVLLRVIDSLWVEHLTAVDDMRRGIGLRAYSQRDPLNEFKIEAYRMFDELKSTIRHDVTHTIFRVTVQPQPRTSSRAGAQRDRGPGGRRRGSGQPPAAATATAVGRQRQRRARRAPDPRSAATTRAGAAPARSSRGATGPRSVRCRWGSWGALPVRLLNADGFGSAPPRDSAPARWCHPRHESHAFRGEMDQSAESSSFP